MTALARQPESWATCITWGAATVAFLLAPLGIDTWKQKKGERRG